VLRQFTENNLRQWTRSSLSVSLVLVLVSNLRQVLRGVGLVIRVSITLVWHCSALTTEIHLCTCLALLARCFINQGSPEISTLV
jgi:hypothetical protein